MKELLTDISTAVQRIYREAVDPVSDKFAWEKRPSEGEIAGPPTVLLLGNHSSGKSTFINFLLDQPIQKTGLAPTDDSFTILTYGEKDEKFDGPAVASNPDLPYAGLKNFGPEFLSHFWMKRQPIELLRTVSLIDSPGMIDSAKEDSGRGFDFAGAVRWFAERVDEVLVFFDPDKPGTTGETLQVFMESLQGIDHKLLIVLNKIDQFRSLQDFARAYGALCWNLGKVIPRKDLPLIFTTFVPVENAPESGIPVSEFQQSRDELVTEIKRAPARRVDNMLTQVQDHAERLRVHARVIDHAAKDLRKFRMKLWALIAILVLVGALGGTIAITQQAAFWVPITIFLIAGLVAYGGYFLIKGLVKSEEKRIVAGLGAVFEEIYARELLVRDHVEDLRMLWNVVHPRTKTTLEKLGLLSFKSLRHQELDKLNRTLDKTVPELRSRLHKETGVGATS